MDISPVGFKHPGLVPLFNVLWKRTEDVSEIQISTNGRVHEADVSATRTVAEVRYARLGHTDQNRNCVWAFSWRTRSGRALRLD